MKLQYILPFALAIAACGCGKSDKAESTVANTEEELPIVDIDVAHAADVEQVMSYTANVEAFNSNNISPAAPNRIKAIYVEVGDHVRRGQVVAVLDNTQAAQLKVNLDQIEREYNRATQLLKIGSGTQAAVDQVKAQLDAARTQYNNVLENTTLTSPVSGVVTARNYDPGDMSSAQPIVTIGQITPNVKVIINITENDIASIRTGMPVSVSLDAFPDETFAGKIARIYPQVDPTSRTFQAEVLVPNANGKIFPGMFARVTLSHGIANHVIVPDRAVVKQTGSGNKYVYVLKGNKVTYNRVELGQRLNDGYEVLSGVADGDTVIISGQTRLADGVKVELLNQNKK